MTSRARRARFAFALGAASVATSGLFGSACGAFGVDGHDPQSDGATDEQQGRETDAASSADAAPVSCADLLARDPSLRGHSDRYTIDPDGPSGKPALIVYCEMAVDDGGWTLIARSSVKAAAFGWTSPNGDIADVGAAYAIDVMDAGLSFGEVMVADRAPYEYEPSAHAYAFAVAPNFVATHLNAPFATAVRTVLGDCTIDGGPTSLRYAGYTGLTDHFFFGDNPGSSTGTGLGSDVFKMTGSDCATGASLDGQQGLVYVR
jgi:hypothetical protein